MQTSPISCKAVCSTLADG